MQSSTVTIGQPYRVEAKADLVSAVAALDGYTCSVDLDALAKESRDQREEREATVRKLESAESLVTQACRVLPEAILTQVLQQLSSYDRSSTQKLTPVLRETIKHAAKSGGCEPNVAEALPGALAEQPSSTRREITTRLQIHEDLPADMVRPSHVTDAAELFESVTQRNFIAPLLSKVLSAHRQFSLSTSDQALLEIGARDGQLASALVPYFTRLTLLEPRQPLFREIFDVVEALQGRAGLSDAPISAQATQVTLTRYIALHRLRHSGPFDTALLTDAPHFLGSDTAQHEIVGVGRMLRQHGLLLVVAGDDTEYPDSMVPLRRLVGATVGCARPETLSDYAKNAGIVTTTIRGTMVLRCRTEAGVDALVDIVVSLAQVPTESLRRDVRTHLRNQCAEPGEDGAIALKYHFNVLVGRQMHPFKRTGAEVAASITIASQQAASSGAPGGVLDLRAMLGGVSRGGSLTTISLVDSPHAAYDAITQGKPVSIKALDADARAQLAGLLYRGFGRKLVVPYSSISEASPPKCARIAAALAVHHCDFTTPGALGRVQSLFAESARWSAQGLTDIGWRQIARSTSVDTTILTRLRAPQADQDSLRPSDAAVAVAPPSDEPTPTSTSAALTPDWVQAADRSFWNRLYSLWPVQQEILQRLASTDPGAPSETPNSQSASIRAAQAARLLEDTASVIERWAAGPDEQSARAARSAIDTCRERLNDWGVDRCDPRTVDRLVRLSAILNRMTAHSKSPLKDPVKQFWIQRLLGTAPEDFVAKTADLAQARTLHQEVRLRACLGLDQECSRDELAQEALSQVGPTVFKLARRLPAAMSTISTEDLRQEALLALYEVAERFDFELGNKFSTFSAWRVRGAILDSIRKLDFVSRSERNRAKTEAGGTPLPTTTSIHRTLSENPKDGSTTSLVDTIPDPKSAQAHGQSERGDFWLELTRGMGNQERQVLLLVHRQELTMAEAGANLGLSESRVSQLHTAAFAHVQGRFNGEAEYRELIFELMKSVDSSRH